MRKKGVVKQLLQLTTSTNQTNQPTQGSVAKWLRRWPANSPNGVISVASPFGGACSNHVTVGVFLFVFLFSPFCDFLLSFWGVLLLGIFVYVCLCIELGFA
ncbi:hypothetical protein BD289DRAFT_445846 [Coniella lustricola]|uniref:Transmembrane protein n=1 Tax=Coniella lustricola TaxID=2025994 RepID=A0A2T2ZUH9_9PEZI|nr:hypothetical protein BD289DRAFT_445846 [Coniella lustricola]